MNFDAETHQECLQYLRTVISEGNPESIGKVAGIIADVCQRGYADKQAIWDSLSDSERARWRRWFARSEF